MPVTDWALIEQTVRNVDQHLPLLGAPSSVGFHHPGPWPYLVLAAPYRLLGSDPESLSLATGSFAAACVLGIVWTAWRRGGLLLAVLAAAVSVWMVGSQAPGTLADPWNPWMAVLPAFWFLLAVWSALDGDLAMLPWAVATGSFAVQAHIAYVPLVVVVAVLALGSAWALHRVAPPRSETAPTTTPPPDGGGGMAERATWDARRAAVVSAAVGVALWFLPLFEAVNGSPGNVVNLWRYATRGSSDTAGGLTQAPGILASELGLSPPWITGDEPVEAFTDVVSASGAWQLAVPIVLLGIGLWATMGRGVVGAATARTVRGGLVVAAAGLVGAAFAVLALDEGRGFAYVVRFTWPVGAFLGLVVAWALLQQVMGDPLVRRLPASALPLVLSLVVLVAGVRVVVTGGSEAPPAVGPEARALVAECLAEVLPEVRATVGGSPVRLDTAEFWPVLAGSLFNELDREGHDVAVSEDLGFYVQRPGGDPGAGVVVLLVADDEALGRWSPPDGATELTRCDLLDPAERTALEAMEARVAAGGSLDEEETLASLVYKMRSERWYVYRVE